MKRLVGLVIVVVVAVIAGTAFFNLPQRIGLVESPTEKLLSAITIPESTCPGD